MKKTKILTGLTILLLCLSIINNSYSQSHFKQMVDVSATTLPYNETTIGNIKNDLEQSLAGEFGWVDKIIWIKGTVKNASVGAIDGKCKTNKGEIIYFRAILRGGSILWDSESFSEQMKSNANSFRAERAKTIDDYLQKLKSFETKLLKFYNSKYDSIISNYQTETDSTLHIFTSCMTNKDKEELKSIFDTKRTYAKINNWKEKMTEIIAPIEMYRSDFKIQPNKNEYYSGIISKSTIEFNKIDSIISSKIIKPDEFNMLLSEMITKLTVKQTEYNKRIALNKEINDLNKNMQNRILEIIFAVKDKKNKKQSKVLYNGGTEEQKVFYDKWLKPYNPYPENLTEYSYGIIPAYKAQFYGVGSNSIKKLKILQYWDSNLRYWESITIKNPHE